METQIIEHLEKQGFEGIDVSLETSLFEYGMAWREISKDRYFFILMSNGRETYRTTTMDRKEFEAITKESWFDIDRVCEWCDSTP